MDDKIPIMYGVWLPGSGWLKTGINAQFPQFADYNREKAQQVANMVGHNAQVRYIDKSIVELEQLYLERERRTLWHIFRTYFNHKKR